MTNDKTKQTFTKKEIIEALTNEDVIYSDGDFFVLPKMDYQSVNNFTKRYPLREENIKAFPHCKVCAIGAILRSKFSFETINEEELLKRAVGTYYCFDDDWGTTDYSLEDTYHLTTEHKEVEQLLNDKMFLSALSCVFEVIHPIVDAENQVQPYLVKFVEDNFPDSIEI